jgi:hypothetical protein
MRHLIKHGVTPQTKHTINRRRLTDAVQTGKIGQVNFTIVQI